MFRRGEIILLFAVVVFAICTVVLGIICLLADETSDTFLAKNVVSFRRWTRWGIEKIFGRWVASKVDQTVRYVFQSNNCLAQAFYLALLVGGYTLFVVFGHPLFPNTRFSEWHLAGGAMAAGNALASFTAASLADPGFITKENVEEETALYEYGGFFEKAECRTCKVNKPARSKHCRLCGHCVARFDHHCIWIANCVGAKNIGRFFWFLASNTVICLYASYGIPLIILGEFDRRNIWNARFRAGDKIVQASPRVYLDFLLTNYTALVAVWFLCVVIGAFLLIFSSWQVVEAVGFNATGNEFAKSQSYAHSCPHIKVPEHKTYNRGWRRNLVEVFSPERFRRQAAKKIE